MDFTSVPLYLDPPNWQQHQNFQQEGENPQLQPPLLPPATGPGLAGAIRPGSMADRVRLAKMPQPEPALKCPRCDSSNTKFCYYNNYSQTQPRHFCKTCRRYWTKGGALRNVPVGGGCRRNKKSKGNSSKSPATHSGQTSSSTSSFPSGSRSSEALGHNQSAPPPQFPFMPGLNHLTDYGDADIRFNFGGIHPTSSYGAARSGADMDFHQMGVSSSGGGGNVIAGPGGGTAEGWRIPQLQQFPFFASLDPPQGLYTFEGQGVEPGGGASGQVIRVKPSGSSGASQMASVKMEENQGLNLSGQFMAIQGNSQYWSTGNAWTDLSGFTSSSATHML